MTTVTTTTTTTTTMESSYDYIVCGAGSSGCVVASRLSEDSDLTVLLLEAGPTDDVDPRIKVPGHAASLRGTNIDWNYKVSLNSTQILAPGLYTGGHD